MIDKIETTEEQQQPFILDGWDQGGVKTPFTLESTQDSIYEQDANISNQAYNNWETAKHSGQLMWEDTTLGVMMRKSDIDNARKTHDFLGNEIFNPLLSKEEANLRYSKYGVTFTDSIRQNEADIIAAKKIKENDLRERLNNSEGTFMSGASSLLGGMVGAMLDPINIATAFIPVTKIIPGLKALEAAGAWGRVAVKGIDGVIMNSLVEPLPLWMAGIDQRDYSMADSLFNITAGGLFGAGIGGFTEGVRALSAGEKFNSNLAASIDFANNRGLDNVLDMQKKRPAITSMAYDDLISLPQEKLSVAQVGNNYVVRLNEDSPLSKVVGYGKDAETARANLRQQIGALLNDDSIYKGYRLDDGLDNMFKAIKASNNLDNVKWVDGWLEKLQHKALKAGMSLEDYIAKQTNNFTDFTRLVSQIDTVRAKQLKYGELSSDLLDELIEQDALEISAYAKIKDAMAANQRQQVNFDTYLGDLNERNYNQKQQYDRFTELSDNTLNTRVELERLQKQLDVAEDLTEREFLTQKINDLNESINTLEKDIADFLKHNDIDMWKYDADNAELLYNLRNELTTETRTFDDVKEALRTQVADESGKSWDTADSILDDMTIDEIDPSDPAKLNELQADIEIATSDIKTALTSNRFTKEEIMSLGIDADGNSIEMRRADKRIEDMDKFSQAAEDYAACRRTEVI